MLTKDAFRFILKYWLLSRLIIFFLEVAAIHFFHFKPTYPYSDSDLQPLGSRFWWTWAGFDGVHYIKLVKEGYLAGFSQAFFPLYPLLIKLLNFLVGNILTSGLIISNLAFILFLSCLYQLLLFSFEKKIVEKTIKIYLFFPTSFFFNSLYTESLFVFLASLIFYFLKKKKWLITSFLGGLASATRLVGISFGLVLLVEWFRYQSRKDKKLVLKGIGYFLCASWGFWAYLLFLRLKFNDPFIFIKSMSLWQKNKLVFFGQTFFRYFKMMFDFSLSLEKYFLVIFEFLTASLFLYLLIDGFRKLKLSFFVYSFFSLFIPLSSGTFSSLPRYVLALFPLFAILAERLAKSKKLSLGYWFFNFLFLFIVVSLFVSGRFIS
jgi:Gpi18-like mannosyltransferase